ncbi:MAG: M28 family peptidase, partial [Gemmatimonadaceae bacterium]|nr:M28 family peptidase [Gemmatimonadaceae bacterium]
VVAMLNFDMVGRLRDDKLIVYGTATATGLPALLETANAAGGDARLKVTGIGDGFGPSDHSSFYGKDIPVLHFFTDLHDDYHRATDDSDKLNAEGTARVADLAHRVTRAIANRPARLEFVRSAGPPAMTGNRQGSQTYLGSIPDMAAGDVPGLRLTGVRAGSPADLGGLKAGDVIVEFAGAPVKDLYTYTDALYAHQPGDTVKVVVMRGEVRVPLTVTLGKRGG